MKELINQLGCNLTEYENRWQGPCPLHEGDNQTAFCIYKDTGVWNCFTSNCNEKYGKSLQSFFRAYIELNPDFSLSDDSVIENKFSPIISCAKRIKQPRVICDREYLLDQLQIPSPYYLARGFSENTLIKHDVGLCKQKGKEMYGRNVIPIYNHSYTGIVGCSGRLDTPVKDLRWRHSKGFPRKYCLYNSWFASSYVKRSQSLIITEGPGKVWKLEDCGYMNSIATLGTKISLEQKQLISKMSPRNIYLIMDNDKAGRESSAQLKEELKRYYNVNEIITPFEDLDEEDTQKVKEFLKQICPQ